MTKREMLAFLDKAIEQLRSRWLVAAHGAKGAMKRDGETLKAIRAALEKHVPADVPEPERLNLPFDTR